MHIEEIDFNRLMTDKDDFTRISKMMEKGIQTDLNTSKDYFTGYSYNTLYDWDQYFEAIVQLHLGWDSKYIKNGVTIFLDNQCEDGFIMRRINGAMEEQKNIGTIDNLNSAPHSGMDNQIERVGSWGACFSEGVDLNYFLYRECIAFSVISEALGQMENEELFKLKAESLKKLISEKMWCEEDGFFYDLHERNGEFIKIKSSSCFSPLFSGVATKKQADRIICEHLLNPSEFWRAFPIPSYAATEPGYREERTREDVGCNWRAQTWIPVNYYVMHGLIKYGYTDIAKQLAYKTYEMVKKIGDREYYNTDSCTGNGLNPFWGWSLLAYFMPIEVELGYDPTS